MGRWQGAEGGAGIRPVGARRASNLDPWVPGRIRKEIAVKRIVSIFEERLLPPVAAPGHMVGNAGNDDAEQAGHAVEARSFWGLLQLSP